MFDFKLLFSTLKYVAVAVAIVCILYYFRISHVEAVEATKNATMWENNYYRAVRIAEDNFNTITELATQQNVLMEELKDWRERQSATERQLNATKKRIQSLERENEKVRATLSTAIPCELWEQIFPDTPKCPRKN